MHGTLYIENIWTFFAILFYFFLLSTMDRWNAIIKENNEFDAGKSSAYNNFKVKSDACKQSNLFYSLEHQLDMFLMKISWKGYGWYI